MTTFKFPKTLGACADRVYELRQKRLEAQKVVDALQEEETALREHIINTLPKSEATGAAGKVARVTVVTKQIPQVKDWQAFYAYVKKNNAWDLMQRRLAAAAVTERWEAGKTVAGVEAFTAVTLSVNKV
ncbi:D/-alanyl-D/-alanine carboxypeptidase [Caudoviricetes sp.]|nr:D/-alanyl-D/-alanine carboxypeptidase [Caudoviricetes sp.]